MLAGSNFVVLGEVLFQIEEDNLAAGRLEGEGHVDEPIELLPDRFMPLGRHEEQNEASPSGAKELAADSASGTGRLIKRIHLRVGHLVAQAALGQPGLVQQFAESDQVLLAAENGSALFHQVLHSAQELPRSSILAT